MKAAEALSVIGQMTEFAELVNITVGRVSQLIADGILPPAGTLLEWLHAYCARLREQAAGRASDGPLDLAQERAALARAQREGIEIKNAALRGEYAPVELLAEVLAAASQAVTERFEHLPGVLRKTCPQLTDADRDHIAGVIAAARNEWVRSTADLVAAKIDTTDDQYEIELAGLEGDDAA
jgi:phage terminase Nu1 subunit (DNA packaging protein)